MSHNSKANAHLRKKVIHEATEIKGGKGERKIELVK